MWPGSMTTCKKHAVVEQKFIYGGMFVDKYFCKLDNGEDIQVSQRDYDRNDVGKLFKQTDGKGK